MDFSKSLKEVSDLLNKENFKLHQEWLDACVDFIINTSKCSISELKEKVIEQFALTDISETSIPFLLKNLKNNKITKINSPMILQVNFCLCISNSYFGQYKEINDIDHLSIKTKKDNTESPKSTYLLEITDGVEKYQAVTVNIIPWINETLQPGFKIRIIQSDVRNGIFMLTSSNCKYLGGFVESLQEINSKKNILKNLLLNIKNNDQQNDQPAKIISNNEQKSSPPKNIPIEARTTKPLETRHHVEQSNTRDKSDRIPSKVKVPDFDNFEFNDSLSGFTDDSLDDFIKNIDEKQLLAPPDYFNMPSTNIKPKTCANTVLDVKLVPSKRDRPFYYLSGIPEHQKTPFLSKAIVTKVLTSLKLTNNGHCSMTVMIDDGTMARAAIITCTMLNNPPFMISSELILDYLKGEGNTFAEMKERIKLIESVLYSSYHTLLLRKILSLKDQKENVDLEIMAIYDEYTNEYIEYMKYIAFKTS